MNLYILVVAIILVMLTATIIYLLFAYNKLQKKYNSFISKFEKNENIEDTLDDYIQFVKNVNEENKIIKANELELEKRLDKSLQKLGIVRYNAFDDVGSELSFALALLDKKDNGFVINAIYSRSSSNVYIKPIDNGTSKYHLSDEEIKAISKAKEE